MYFHSFLVRICKLQTYLCTVMKALVKSLFKYGEISWLKRQKLLIMVLYKMWLKITCGNNEENWLWCACCTWDSYKCPIQLYCFFLMPCRSFFSVCLFHSLSVHYLAPFLLNNYIFYIKYRIGTFWCYESIGKIYFSSNLHSIGEKMKTDI